MIDSANMLGDNYNDEMCGGMSATTFKDYWVVVQYLQANVKPNLGENFCRSFIHPSIHVVQSSTQASCDDLTQRLMICMWNTFGYGGR